METSRTTALRYSGIARFLHWITAGALLTLYCSIYFKNWFTEEDSAVGLTALQLHQVVGLSVAVFIVWRVWWRLTATMPSPLEAPRYARLAAGSTHAALYCALILMPLTGYLYASNPTSVFGLFGIPAFGDTTLCHWLESSVGLSLKLDIRAPSRFVHRVMVGPILLPVLISAHVAAALYHHYVLHDDTLGRMLSAAGRGQKIDGLAKPADQSD
jgi:cytochrome b561